MSRIQDLPDVWYARATAGLAKKTMNKKAAVQLFKDADELKAILGPACVGYPDCDGDLEGEPHSDKCPQHASAAGKG